MIIKNRRTLKAFTLAEMMIVMLVLSIITAAFVPIMTKRSRMNSSNGSSSEIWQWADGNTIDAYFGSGATQSAVIGANTTDATEAKLIINAVTADIMEFPHIAFKQNNILNGRLAIGSSTIQIGMPSVVSEGTPIFANNTIAIGPYVSAQTAGDIAIGYWTMNRAKTTARPADPNTAIFPIGNTGGNIAIGGAALNNISGGDRNIGIGPAAGNTTTAKYDNISIGAKSGLIFTGNSNIAIGLGSQTIGNVTNGSLDPTDTSTFVSSTVAIGKTATAQKDYAVAVGDTAVAAGLQSIAIGKTAQALKLNSIAIGGNGGASTIADGDCAIAMGDTAYAFSYGSIAFGPWSKAEGDNGVAIGSGAHAGYSDVAIGNSAMKANARSYTSAHGNNVGIGTGVLRPNYGSTFTGENNVAIGEYALWSVKSGNHNIAIGYHALDGDGGANGDVAKGNYNTAIGYQSLTRSAGSYNVALGTFACNTSTTGTNNICIGYNADVPAGTSNTIVLGNGSITSFQSKVALTVTSDVRLKNLNGDFTSGLDKIKELKPYNYTFKNDKEKIQRVGVTAQDLQKIFPNAVTRIDQKGHLGIRQDDMFYAMINSIKELDSMFQGFVKDFKALVAKVQTLDDKVVALIKVDQINSQKIDAIYKELNEIKKENKQLKSEVQSLKKKIK